MLLTARLWCRKLVHVEGALVRANKKSVSPEVFHHKVCILLGFIAPYNLLSICKLRFTIKCVSQTFRK